MVLAKMILDAQVDVLGGLQVSGQLVLQVWELLTEKTMLNSCTGGHGFFYLKDRSAQFRLAYSCSRVNKEAWLLKLTGQVYLDRANGFGYDPLSRERQASQQPN